ncbi:MAG: hypothetical protein UH854_01780 [Clostridia bacterium]|nr:hypothetical protein [Clostridia bacterium]
MRELENQILNMERVKYLSNMATERLMSYDEDEFSQHYNEILSIFSFLDEQINEKFDNLSKTYYNEI